MPWLANQNVLMPLRRQKPGTAARSPWPTARAADRGLDEVSDTRRVWAGTPAAVKGGRPPRDSTTAGLAWPRPVRGYCSLKRQLRQEHAMELGVALPTSGPDASPEAIGRVAEGAERIGLAAVWTYERLLRPAEPI